MGTEIAVKPESSQPRRRISAVYALRLAAVPMLAAFVVMAMMIVFSDPIRKSDGFFIQSIEPGSPANLAGVQGILTRVNGKPITTYNDLQEDIFNSLGEPMTWTMELNNEVRVVQLTPLARPEFGQSATGVVSSQNLTRPVGRLTRIIEIVYLAYIGVGLLVLAEIVAWQRKRRSKAVSNSVD